VREHDAEFAALKIILRKSRRRAEDKKQSHE
jgi:hypothetical protein